MGGELVGLPPESPKEKTSMSKYFWDAYPAYISMGMPPDEYWNGDAEACVAYRKAYQEKLDMQDVMSWRQGLYFYHALCCVAPAFNSLNPQQPKKFIEPFGIGKKKEPEAKRENVDPGFAYVKAWADRVNRMMEQNGRR